MPEENKRYKGIKPEIAQELQTYETEYFREDKPVPFCGMLIYPATMHDFETYIACSSCFSLNKNETPQGIRMTQLEYLYNKTQDKEEGPLWSYKLQKICEIIFHISNGLKCKKCGHVIKYTDKEFTDFIGKIQKIGEGTEEIPVLKCPKCEEKDFIEMIKFSTDPQTKKVVLIIDGNVIDSKDYERLRQIVLFQNDPEYADDSWVDPSIKQDYQERMKIQREKNDVHASVEKKMVCLSIATNYKLSEIYDMSIRKFTMCLEAVEDLINYKINKTAVSSGFVSLPKGQTLDHWIYKKDEDMYGRFYKSLDDAQRQVS